MPTPEIIEFERLLAPISDESPVGSDVRQDFSADSPYFGIKEAQAEARTSERKRREAFDDVPDTEFQMEEWEPVLQLAEEILCTKAKDLEVAAWYLDALLRQHGFAGLRDGLRLIRELVDQYWDGIFPRPDEDGLATVVAPIEALNGALTFPISNIPLTAVEPWGDWQYRQAQSQQDVPPDEVEEGAITLSMFDSAVSDTPVDFFRDLIADIEAAEEELKKLSAVLEELCGKDDSGYPISPSINDIETSLTNALQTVRTMTSGLDLEPEPAADQQAAAEQVTGVVVAQTAVSPASQTVDNREQAYRQVQQLADYFKKVEPHSPTAYLLEKAVRWGRLPFPRLMKELVDEPSLGQLYRVMGISATAVEDEEQQD